MVDRDVGQAGQVVTVGEREQVRHGWLDTLVVWRNELSTMGSGVTEG